MRLSVKRSIVRQLDVEKRDQHEKRRLDAVYQYLAKHRLEEDLADALQEVIRDKPEDPRALLSCRLLRPVKHAPLLPAVHETSGRPTLPAEDMEAARDAAEEAAHMGAERLDAEGGSHLAVQRQVNEETARDEAGALLSSAWVPSV